MKLTNNTSGGGQDIAQLVNLSGSAATETGLSINNLDPDDPVNGGLEFVNNAFTTAVDASDPDVDTALDIGANDIETSTAIISSAELGKLDGNPQRTVNIPLGSFLNITTSSTIDFGAAADGAPDFQAINNGVMLVYDVTAGSPDIDAVASTFTVPEDYASGDTIKIRASKSGHGGVPERLLCGASINGAAGGGLTGSATTTSSANTSYSFSLGVAYASRRLGLAGVQGRRRRERVHSQRPGPHHQRRLRLRGHPLTPRVPRVRSAHG